jgi:uncharacterized protein YbcI
MPGIYPGAKTRNRRAAGLGYDLPWLRFRFEVIATTDTTAPAGAGPLLAELSRRLVQVLRREVGRGPTQAQSHWAGADVLVVLFGDVFLRSEKTLLSHGEEEVAMAYRGAIQHAVREAMRAEVELVVGRKVIAAMGCAHHEPDLMAEVFVFARDAFEEAPLGRPTRG